jgi:hypothetical protein
MTGHANKVDTPLWWLIKVVVVGDGVYSIEERPTEE